MAVGVCYARRSRPVRHCEDQAIRSRTRPLAAVLLLALACASAEEPVPDVRIGLLSLRADPVLPASRSLHQAAELAVRRVNAAGGLDVGGVRHRVVLVSRASGDTPESAVAAAQRLINQDGVVAIVGPFYSDLAIPVGALAERAGVPLISPGATHPDVTRDRGFVFRIPLVDDLQGRVLARFARRDLEARTAAVLWDQANVYSRGLAAEFRRTFAEAGGEVVAQETYLTGTRDFRSQLERIRVRAPEVLFMASYAPEAAEQARQVRELGLAATLLGPDAWNSSNFDDPSAVEGAYLSHHWHPDVARGNPTAEAFLAAYDEEVGGLPDVAAAATWDALALLFEAIRQRASVDGSEIRDFLAHLEDYRGVTGTFSYRGSGDPVKPGVILRIEDGESRLVRVLPLP